MVHIQSRVCAVTIFLHVGPAIYKYFLKVKSWGDGVQTWWWIYNDKFNFRMSEVPIFFLL